ncbi:MAG TPA: hypothetical protein VK400_13565 [Pyrinomonadaceae bacterium]|nr:hypothetical protein [Pyrinomonadaceae bacterium]
MQEKEHNIVELIEELFASMLDKSDNELRSYLRGLPPVDAGQSRSIVVGNEHSTLVYNFDRDRTYYELRSQYAELARFPTKLIKNIAKEFSIDLRRAKMVVLANHLILSDCFVAEGLRFYEETARQSLIDAQIQIEKNGKQKTIARWRERNSHEYPFVKSAAIAELNKIGDLVPELVKSLEGHPLGVRNVYYKSDLRERERELSAKSEEFVESAKNLYLRIYKEQHELNSAAVGDKNSVEEKITAVAVAKNANISRTNFYYWCKEIGITPEEIKTQGIINARQELGLA